MFDAEAVDKNVQGSQEIPHTVVTDSGQATELRTEHENQKKKLKMDNLAKPELKRNKEKLPQDAKILTEGVTKHRVTVPDFEEGKSGKRKGKIDTLMEQARALEIHIESTNNDSARVRENIKEAKVALQKVERELWTLEGLVYSSKKEVQALKADGNNRLAAFGAQMPKIVEEIRKFGGPRGFVKAPIGPLGAHINLVEGSDEKLAKAVEGELGGLVSCFLCDNSADQHKLFNLFQKMKLRNIPPIFTCKFTDVKHNVTASKVQNGKYKTLIDCVDIADANVFNRVVDSCNLEKMLFIPIEANAKRGRLEREL